MKILLTPLMIISYQLKKSCEVLDIVIQKARVAT
jgi:hypothetical protein